MVAVDTPNGYPEHMAQEGTRQRWFCPVCDAKVDTFVDLSHVPNHLCRTTNNVTPMHLEGADNE